MLAIEVSSLESFHYINGKLDFVNGSNREQIINSINLYAEELVDGVYSSGVVDYALRCLCFALEKEEIIIGQETIEHISKSLEVFEEYYRFRHFVSKYSKL